MDSSNSEVKKKDPDSFSLDPDIPDVLDSQDIYFRPEQNDAQNVYMSPTLHPVINSPRIRKNDSFSQEDGKVKHIADEFSTFPLNTRMTLNLCGTFNKELKSSKKINNFLSTMEENLKLTEQLVKRQEKRIDEFFQEIYDLFQKNFFKMSEVYKQSQKSRLQQEFTEYRYTHDVIKSNLEHILTHDPFSKLLQQELFSLSSSLNQALQTTATTNILGAFDTETKPDINQLYTSFLDSSPDLKYGLTPLTKKFKLIQYTLSPNHDKPVLSQTISPNISEIKKEPLKDLLNISAELENFVAKLSLNFSNEIMSVTHPHSQHIYTIEKIAKSNIKILPFDASGKTIPQPEPEENAALRKRLSHIDLDDTSKFIEDSVDKEKEKEKEKEPRSPQLSNRSASDSGRVQPTLTPVKNISYKVPPKENLFTGNMSWSNNGDMSEISYQTQLISVHYNLSVGDLVSLNGAPFRILYKEWVFPEDIMQLANIFTGETVEVKYNSRYSAMEDQVITKKYQVIKISDKKGYYLVMDTAWDKSDTMKKLPKVIETKNVLDKKLEDDIRESFYSDKKALVHVLNVKNQEIIVSYRKEWL